LVLLVAEFILLGAACRVSTLLGDAGWWARLTGQSKILTWVGTATVTALLIFGTAQLRRPRASLLERLRHPRFSWPLFIAHLIGFFLFAQLTSLITRGRLQDTPEASAWVLLWAGTGLFLLLSWAATAFPGTGLGVLLASAVAGAMAWLIGGGVLLCWGVLKYPAFSSVRALLSLLFNDVVCRPDTDIIGTERFRVSVEPGCTGCEGIGLIWVCLGLYLWCYRQDLRWPQALLLLPLGTALIWAANTVRIAALVAVGVWLSPEAAVGGFHSHAGWLAFNGIALGLIAVTRSRRFFARAPAAGQEEENPAAPYLLPLLALVAATMVSSALSEDFDVFYPFRVGVVAGVLLFFRHAYAGLGWSWSWGAVAIGAAAFVVWMALEFVRGAPPDTGLRTGLESLSPAWAFGWVCFRVAGSVVTVPLAEELGFRGYLLRRLVAADFRAVSPGQFTWTAVIVSSALFGVLHGRWLAGMLAGLLYAFALARRGRVSDAVLAHATTNALIAAYVLATRTWSLWC
jgi:exosortase E/protease (VPEID-CTERM system)